MNGLTDAQLAAAGFQSRPPIAYNRMSRDFRYQCSDCGLWFRTIEFSPAGAPICDRCTKEGRADWGEANAATAARTSLSLRLVNPTS